MAFLLNKSLKPHKQQSSFANSICPHDRQRHFLCLEGGGRNNCSIRPLLSEHGTETDYHRQNPREPQVHNQVDEIPLAGMQSHTPRPEIKIGQRKSRKSAQEHKVKDTSDGPASSSSSSTPCIKATVGSC